MPKDSKSVGDFKGLGDSRPSSSPKQKPNEGGHTPVGVGDWRGLPDSRPSSSTTSQKSGKG